MTKCVTAKWVVDHVTALLADDGCATVERNQRWSSEFLRNALTLALGAVTKIIPTAFTETRDIALQEGSVQTLPADVITVTSFGDTVYKTADGEPVACGNQVNKADWEFLQAYEGSRCSAAKSELPANATPAQQAKALCGSYSVSGYSYTQNTPGQFRVVPGVPTGVTAFARLTVGVCPDCVTDANYSKPLLCDRVNALVEYMLYQAYIPERSDPLAAKRREEHYGRFADIMKLDYKTLSRLGSGYYLGEVGDGDPQVQR